MYFYNRLQTLFSFIFSYVSIRQLIYLFSCSYFIILLRLRQVLSCFFFQLVYRREIDMDRGAISGKMQFSAGTEKSLFGKSVMHVYIFLSLLYSKYTANNDIVVLIWCFRVKSKGNLNEGAKNGFIYFKTIMTQFS